MWRTSDDLALNKHEETWERLKAAAASWAASGRALPSDQECADQVHSIHKELFPGFELPESALKFYTAEFQEMVAVQRRSEAGSGASYNAPNG